MATSRDVVVVVANVPAVVIVHVAVVVVINAVVGHFPWIRPMVVDEICVAVIGTPSFENGHDDACTVASYTSGCHIPSEVRINVVIARLDVVPLLAKIRVVWHRLPLRDYVVQLCRPDMTMSFELAQGFGPFKTAYMQQVDVGGRRRNAEHFKINLIGQFSQHFVRLDIAGQHD